MTSVPSTPTATDKLEEVRKLNVEIAGLTQARGLARDAADEAIQGAEEAGRRAKAAEEHLGTLEATMAGSAAEIREFVAYCRNILQTAMSVMEELGTYAKAMQVKIDGLTREIKTAQEALEALRVGISKENESISQKREDLNIYHERIVAAAEEVGIKVKL